MAVGPLMGNPPGRLPVGTVPGTDQFRLSGNPQGRLPVGSVPSTQAMYLAGGGTPTRAQGRPGEVSGRVLERLPEAGSPLMKQLIAFIQRRNPAAAVTAENVGGLAQAPGALNPVARGPNSRPGTSPHSMFNQLRDAGLARFVGGMAPSVTDLFRGGNGANYVPAAAPAPAGVGPAFMGPPPPQVGEQIPGYPPGWVIGPGGFPIGPTMPLPTGNNGLVYPPGQPPMGSRGGY